MKLVFCLLGNIEKVIVEQDFLYGIRDGALCRVNKNDYTVEELIKDDIRKYVKHNNTIFLYFYR